MKPHICLIQPPFVQLNSPYPSIYYLRSFLEQRGYSVSVSDHSIGLFEKIFCREGLERIFADARKKIGFQKTMDPIVERFLTDEKKWISSIDRIIAFLRGKDREWGHLISLTNGVLPEGVSFFNYMMEQYRETGDVSADSATLLASKLLADIANFITASLDAGFSLIRYVSSPCTTLSAGFHNFSDVEAGLNGYIMNTFYRPLLEEEWKRLAGKIPDNAERGDKPPLVIGLTIPFPGCLTGALVCAESAKGYFGGKVITVAGGGYVNTELRFITEEKLFDYFDYLSFDRGYGSLDAILERETGNEKTENDPPLYKTMYRYTNGIIIKDEININSNTDGKRIDDEAVQSVFPDYSGVDFSRYICPVDDVNPMHRLWSDGRWLKAYAAHGCYWKNCAFCDVSLDYIRCYRPVNIEALFRHLVAQAEASGVRGVHLVDEACPPASLARLALLNREAGLPLVFWGNIRFEKTFTPDLAALLAAGGIIGVSAGIEIASERGFERIGKGIALSDVVNACAAFKEAGILVHAYLIYGYWDQDDGEIIDSAETLRQLFAEGLLDSAFWHTFVLTKHSRIYAEKMKGLHTELSPSGDPEGNLAFRARQGIPLCGGPDRDGKKIFALNDLSFEGGERFDRFTGPLDWLLQSWMKGDTAGPVRAAFGFKVPNPSVAPNLVLGLLDSYARGREKNRQAAPSVSAKQSARAFFLGSLPIIHLTEKGTELWWRWRFEDCVLRAKPGQAESGASGTWADQTAALLGEASHGMEAAELFGKLEAIFGDDAKRVWKTLRKKGLMSIDMASCIA